MRKISKVSLLFVVMVALVLAYSGVANGAVNQTLGFYDTSYSNLTQVDCRNCHGADLQDRHHVLGLGCSTCHTYTGGVITNTVHDCLVCHPASSPPHHATDVAMAGVCTACHDPNLVVDEGTVAPPTGPESIITPTPASCDTCHAADPAAMPYPILTNDTLHHDTGFYNAGLCAWCHGDAPEIRTCENCHSAGSLHAIAAHTANDAACLSCHGANVPPPEPPPASQPVIASTTPATGVVYSTVVIKGSFFGQVRNKKKDFVYFGLISAPIKYWTDTEIAVTVPNLMKGNYDLTVTTAKGVSNIKVYTVIPVPALTSLTPVAGAVGSTVTIAGSGFSYGPTTVTFNVSGTAYTATSSVVSDTQVTATVPNVPAGAYNVIVTTTGGKSNGKTFTVGVNNPAVLNSILPASGRTGILITLYGSNFGTSRGTSTVKFNGTPAISYYLWSNTMIKCYVPAGLSTGAKPVTVVTPGGTSNAKTFTVTL